MAENKPDKGKGTQDVQNDIHETQGNNTAQDVPEDKAQRKDIAEVMAESARKVQERMEDHSAAADLFKQAAEKTGKMDPGKLLQEAAENFSFSLSEAEKLALEASLKRIQDEIENAISNLSEKLPSTIAANVRHEFDALQPFISEELDARKKKDPALDLDAEALQYKSVGEMLQIFGYDNPEEPEELTPENKIWREIIKSAQERRAQLGELEPFIDEELKARQQSDPEFDNMTISKFLEDIDENGEHKDSVYTQILNAAKERKARSDAAKRTAGKAGTADKKGYLTTIGNRLFVPTDPEFQNAFTTSITAKAGIFKRETGRGNRQLALDINIPFLQAIAQAAFINYVNNDEPGEIRLYIPTFARELGLDINHRAKEAADKRGQEEQGVIIESPADSSKREITRNEAREAFINQFITEIDNIWGVLPHDKTEYKLISVHAYNPETETLYVVSPYFERLITGLVTREAQELEAGKKFYYWHCDLLHADAANERNKAAVEMATRVLVGVQQRGTTPDAKQKQNKKKHFDDEQAVTYSISCSGLIQDCPQIREKLKRQKGTSQKTQTLQRAFKAMYKILKKKSDLYTFYKDIAVKEITPAMSSLNAEIKITHHGQNPKYKSPSLPEKTTDAQQVQELTT